MKKLKYIVLPIIAVLFLTLAVTACKTKAKDLINNLQGNWISDSDAKTTLINFSKKDDFNTNYTDYTCTDGTSSAGVTESLKATNDHTLQMASLLGVSINLTADISGSKLTLGMSGSSGGTSIGVNTGTYTKTNKSVSDWCHK